MGRADKAIETSVLKKQTELHCERQMCVQYDSKSGYFSAAIFWVRADGSEQEIGVQ